MENTTKSLDQVEMRISQLMQSGDAQRALEYIRELVATYEDRVAAIDREIERLQRHCQSTQETLRSLRVVMMLTEGKRKEIQESLPYEDSTLSIWKCAKDVLEREKERMSADELADYIQRGGRNLGAQAAALVTSSLKRHLGKEFIREKRGKKYYYGLIEWSPGARLGNEIGSGPDIFDQVGSGPEEGDRM